MKPLFLFLIFYCPILWGQVGIGTLDPKGALDIESNNMGLVVPRVSSIEAVTNGSAGEAVDATTVYDLSRDKFCFKIAGDWICLGVDASDNVIISNESATTNSNYLKASNTGANDQFGYYIALSADGLSIAVGAPGEDSDSTGINGDESNDNATDSGAVYVFSKTSGVWQQQAYIKASNAEAGDGFGRMVSLSDNGNLLVVNAMFEDSNATGINGNESDNSAFGAGAVYIFSRSGAAWTQEAYIKGSNTEAGDVFGIGISISGDGTRLAVSATSEDSNATGINGNQSNNSASSSGAAYLFVRNAGTWSQEAYIKPSNTGAGDTFGNFLNLNEDGSRLAVGSWGEDSNATGVNGDGSNNSLSGSGAAYVFSRSGTTWTEEAYLKAAYTEGLDYFGIRVMFNDDASVLAVSTIWEDGGIAGVNGDVTDNSAQDSGVVYIFRRSGTTWTQEAYLKAANVEANDKFGTDLCFNDVGTKLIVGAWEEDSNAIDLDGDPSNNSAANSGAVYVFEYSGGNWSQTQYIKAFNTDAGDSFGISVAISHDGERMVVSAYNEASNATGIGGDQTNNSANDAGAVYVYDN